MATRSRNSFSCPPQNCLKQLILGMNDNGTWEGCSKLDQKALNRLEDPQELCPDAPCETKRISITRADGQPDFVVLVRVYRPRSKRVVKTVKGDVFTRRGDKKKTLTPEEVRNLQIDIGEVDFEQEPCGLEYPSQFDAAAIRHFCDSLRVMLELSAASE